MWQKSAACGQVNGKYASGYWLENALLPVGFLPVLLIAKTGNMAFELLFIEIEKRPAISDPRDPKHCNLVYKYLSKFAEVLQLGDLSLKFPKNANFLRGSGDTFSYVEHCFYHGAFYSACLSNDMSKGPVTTTVILWHSELNKGPASTCSDTYEDRYKLIGFGLAVR